MSGLPHKIITGQLLDRALEDLGTRPFHLEQIVAGASGGYSFFGMDVGASWIEHRFKAVTGGVMDPDVPPTGATNGTLLLPYPQARFYVEFVGGSGSERVDVTVWHRHRLYEDPNGSPGPWTKSQVFASCDALQEYVAGIFWHRELYLQLTNYQNNGGTCTAVRVWAAGAGNLSGAGTLGLLDVALSTRAAETTAAAIRTATEIMDDWDAVHDAIAGTDGVRFMGTAYANPSTLPTDVTADGDNARISASRKGEIYVYLSRSLSGENGLTGSSGRIYIQTRGDYGTGGMLTAAGTLHSGACRLYGVRIVTTTAASAVGFIRDGGSAGTQRIPLLLNAVGTQDIRVPGGAGHGIDVYFQPDIAAAPTWAGYAAAFVDTVP